MASSFTDIEVAIALPVYNTYTYRVPETLHELVATGKRVLVPFGRRRVTGYILGSAKGVNQEGIKTVLDILDETALFPPSMIPFFRWTADYYLHPIGDVIKCALPGGLNLYDIFTIAITEKGEDTHLNNSATSFENQILNYAFSFNTNINYIHYRLAIPNEDITLKLSGNYALMVYEDFDTEKVVLIKRFVVTERLTNIQVSVKRPMLSIYRNSGQEIDFSISYGNYQVHDPFSEINVSILQNGRWDNAITHLKPLFIRSGSLEYDHDTDNIFPGGSEFRWFDIKSIRYQSPYIKNVVYRNNIHHVELFPDENRAGKQYFFEADLNGKFYVEVQEQPNDDTDADYVTVYFSMPFEAPLIHGRLYILGGLTNWVFNPANEMKYNFETKSYEAVLLLKQGYYNYQYAFVQEGDTAGLGSYTEGNHYETENDYLIFVYHRPVHSRYDRVIGYQLINSVYGLK